jgi:tetratricopeptide (TPR) repeat protein
MLILAGCGGSSGGGSAIAVFDSSGAPLGTVALAHSCTDDAAVHLGRGLALLHSMTYEESRASFVAATEADPNCAMGYWGQAMTFVHPLWSDPPDAATFEHGVALLGDARALAGSDRERAYVDAIAAYYAAGEGESEKPNLVAFESGWRGFHERYPKDPEGTAFYALAQLSTVDPGDKTFSKQRAAGAMAEEVLEQVPDHPGGHHYVIHAYDNPALSAKAEDVARNYGKVAPDIPHALHMPTHTFTRLGLWQESIDWNRRSADAALKRPVGSETSLHYFHALDYLAYAYLQGAEDRRADAVLEELEGVEPPYQAHVASAYTFAAVPARLALERHMWEAAANLKPRIPGQYPWETAAAMEAITYFARALGAARSGRFEQARADLETLGALQERVAAKSPYWGTQVEVQRLSALAWLQYEQGSRERGLSTMQAAADLEASTEKHPVTPGEVLPARELLGDMLLELGRHEEALAAYEAALDRSPNRFNSLYGAGRAAESSGNGEVARRYYEALIEVTANADTERERLEYVRSFLATG